jgi:hypothetical protein
MPPSAIIGTPLSLRASKTIWMAVICGTPTPATMRVVQIEPGPMPTLTPSAMVDHRPRCIGRGDVAADHFDLRKVALDPTDAVEHALRMAVCRVDHEHVDACLGEQLGALLGARADTDGSADAQATSGILAASGVRWS